MFKKVKNTLKTEKKTYINIINSKSFLNDRERKRNPKLNYDSIPFRFFYQVSIKQSWWWWGGGWGEDYIKNIHIETIFSHFHGSIINQLVFEILLLSVT